MKLIGYRAERGVRIAALRGDNGDRADDLGDIEDFYTDPQGAMQAASEGGALQTGDLDRVPPVRPSARVLCVGLNYKAHAAEGGFELPEHPAVFARWTPSLSVGGRQVMVPPDEPGLDWEGELAVVIGAPLSVATEAQARRAFLGYAVFNDMTARRAQRHSSQWTVGKNVDASGPLGPIVTPDEVPDVDTGLRLSTRVNGGLVQDASTADMIFSPAAIAAYLSRIMKLLPGDVIATGTPEGVGHARRPEWFLGDGDVVTVEIAGLGTIMTTVVAPHLSPAAGG